MDFIIKKGLVYKMRRQKIIAGLLFMACLVFNGCAGGNKDQGAAVTSGSSAEENTTASEGSDKNTESGETKEDVLPDGTYSAKFDTDSSMFHVSEACEGKGTLTVKNGEMTIHISLTSKRILNLYCGLAADAQKEGAELLQPTEDVVKFSDGTTEEVYGFDVPVPALGKEFDLALVGSKGKWYDHKVTVSDPEPSEQEKKEAKEEKQPSKTVSLEDGNYTVEVEMEGGSGRASVLSLAEMTVKKGAVTAAIEWSSPNYDYMIVDGTKYLPVNEEGNSVFEIPVSVFDEPMKVIGDTVAMSKPHEIEYGLTFRSETIKPKKK